MADAFVFAAITGAGGWAAYGETGWERRMDDRPCPLCRRDGAGDRFRGNDCRGCRAPRWGGGRARRAAAAEAQPAAAVSAADTAWVLVSAALVLAMTVPGLALFY